MAGVQGTEKSFIKVTAGNGIINIGTEPTTHRGFVH